MNLRSRLLNNQLVRNLAAYPLVKRLLSPFRSVIASPTLDELAAQFNARSKQELASLPATTQRVVFLAGRSVDLKFALNDGLFGWALRLHGTQPTYLICDGALTMCELSTINEFPTEQAFLEAEKPAPCDRCYPPADKILRSYGWIPEKLSAYIQPDTWQREKEKVAHLSLDECFNLEYRGLHLGEHIESTVYRSLFSASLSAEDETALKTARRVALNAVVIADAVHKMFETLKPDRVIAHHGIYLTAGITCDYARQHNIPVINWTIPYRRNTVLFSHNDTYHRTMSSEPVELWRDYPLSDTDRERLSSYLGSHYKSGWDLLSYNRDTDDDPQRLAQELNLDVNKPIIGLYTNLAWDAHIHYAGIVFPSHAEWLAQTVKHFIDNPQVQLVIRVHPAEVKSGLGPVRERADALIHKNYPQLPSHIKIIPPESALSSYALMWLATANVVFGTKMGLEMAAIGLPVIVAGEAWYRGKGFTYDPKSQQKYFDLLASSERLGRLSPDQRELATRYAYHFYFRTMQTIPSLVAAPNVPAVRSLKDLKPGKYPNLDAICKGILDGTPFLAETP